jgi:SAM-dependent methyltransferase
MIFGEESFFSVLACPDCHGALSREGAALVCAVCGARYVRERGYWSLLSSHARAALDGRAEGPWSRWREAIEGLEAWRARQRPPRERSGEAPAHERPDGSSDERTRALLERAVGDEGGLVLDVGAKDGRMRGLVPSRCEYLGVDPFPRGDGAVLRAMAEALPVRDQRAKVVLCHASFDYFVDGAAVLDEFARVLAPRGALALVVSVVHEDVAVARSADRRAARLTGALRATRALGLRAAPALLRAALVRERAHVHYYTRAHVTELLSRRFDSIEVSEVPQRTSAILYVLARPRSRTKLPVL